jgi:nicotinate dehydrogenase subunit A
MVQQATPPPPLSRLRRKHGSVSIDHGARRGDEPPCSLERANGRRSRAMTTAIKLTVNGEARVVEVDDPDMPLLYALRDQLGLHGLHYGCGLAQCGACTVHYYGEALRSCVMPVSAVAGAEIVTLEGLGTAEKPHPVQQAFIDEQAAQCGYCINGMIMQAAALLATTKRPTEAQVRQALAANLCKCGTHVRILRAIMRAAERMA